MVIDSFDKRESNKLPKTQIVFDRTKSKMNDKSTIHNKSYSRIF